MNIAEYSIRHSVVTWVVTLALLGAGWISFQNLSRLEDPEFTIKEAVILTPYPGASAAEVQEEVTDVIERAAQELGQVKRVESRSSRGLSHVKVVIKEKYDKSQLPQVWDELRRKVNDRQTDLPPGAGPSIVNDDFGDVYGVYLALTGDGYSYKELYDSAKFLQRELLKVQDVKRISITGNQKEVVYVEMRREKMAEFGIAPPDIYSALASKNLVARAGKAVVGSERVAINPTGEFKSEKEFRDLLVRGRGPGSERLVYLGDVSDIVRGYEDPPKGILRYDGRPGVALGISTVIGGNVVTMGEALDKRVRELLPQLPLGMEFGIISLQSKAVTDAIDGFVVNLAEAVAIVVGVLLFFMGLRSGLIIGAVLVVTIMGSFLLMGTQHLILERISLGGLIIALGMLVDNAIVVTDGIRVRMQRGQSALTASKEVISQTALPLLGATAIAILAFAPIGLSQDNTGEYCRSLLYVVLISLGLSWFTAMTTTPLLCNVFLKPGNSGTDAGNDPYAGALYQGYRRFLEACLRFRLITLGAVVAMFVAALIGFGFLKVSFFPESTRPQFTLDFWFPEGMRIEETASRLAKAEEYLFKKEGISHVTSAVGGGHARFLLLYTPEKPWEAYGQMLVDVDDYLKIPAMIPEIERELGALFPDAVIAGQSFMLGPGEPGKVRVRITGPDAKVLRRLADRAETILATHSNAKNVRNHWRDRVKV
ncbi:MAG: efflux RND transporter permease subunit, partial [Pseudomonadota bacterium]